MGSRGFTELKTHPFFNGIDWDVIAKREVVSPLLPHLIDNKPELLYNEIKIGEAASLDHLVLEKLWNQEYSLKANSKFSGQSRHFDSQGCDSFSDESEIVHQIPTSE